MKKLNYKISGKQESECGFEVIQGKGKWAGRTVLKVIELPTNRGVSVTNAIEKIVSLLTEQESLDNPVILEYYSDSGYSEVIFNGTTPSWRFVSPAEFKGNCEI